MELSTKAWDIAIGSVVGNDLWQCIVCITKRWVLTQYSLSLTTLDTVVKNRHNKSLLKIPQAVVFSSDRRDISWWVEDAFNFIDTGLGSPLTHGTEVILQCTIELCIGLDIMLVSAGESMHLDRGDIAMGSHSSSGGWASSTTRTEQMGHLVHPKIVELLGS